MGNSRAVFLSAFLPLQKQEKKKKKKKKKNNFFVPSLPIYRYSLARQLLVAHPVIPTEGPASRTSSRREYP